jgi:hypothetical protein
MLPVRRGQLANARFASQGSGEDLENPTQVYGVKP